MRVVCVGSNPRKYPIGEWRIEPGKGDSQESMGGHQTFLCPQNEGLQMGNFTICVSKFPLQPYLTVWRTADGQSHSRTWLPKPPTKTPLNFLGSLQELPALVQGYVTPQERLTPLDIQWLCTQSP